MDSLDEVSALLRSLGASLGVELQLETVGACGLCVDDRLEITLRYEPSPPALLAYSAVGDLPVGSAEELLRALLEANHVWEESRGATWSLYDDGVVLSRLFPLPGLESDTLAAELAAFVEVALAGQQVLRSSQSAERTEAAAAVPALPPGAIAP